MSETTPLLRDFVYLDSDRLRSLAGQLRIPLEEKNRTRADWETVVASAVTHIVHPKMAKGARLKPGCWSASTHTAMYEKLNAPTVASVR